LSRRLTLFLPAVLMLATTMPVVPVRAAQCDPTDYVCQQIGDAKAQAADVQAQIDAVKKNLANAQQAVNQLNAILERLQQQRHAQEQQIAATQAHVDDLARQIRLKQAAIDRSEAQIAVREQYLNLRVRSMDKHGRVDYLELVITSSDFNQLLDRVMLMQAVVRGDQKLLDGLKTERQQLEALKADLARQKADQDAALAKLRQQQAALLVTIDQQNQALAVQQSLAAQYAQQQQELEQALKVAQAQIAYLQQQYDLAAQQLGGGSGRFVWPIGTRNITQGFGCSTLLGEPYDPRCPTRHTHQGIDLAGPYGARIVAADAGIATVQTDCCYGNYVVIVHGNGYVTLYGHMSSFAIHNGPVGRGQLIGYEGSTGYSTGPHLHFQIEYNGTPQNPCLWLGC
jgi:murein DD-endopeptidase MepM/ murein hydrolase activator NlpD